MFNWFINLSLIYQLSITFTTGLLLGILLMNIFVVVNNKKINLYKRQLEKESVSCDENAAKVKVLEAKIQVLEKALENALRNK